MIVYKNDEGYLIEDADFVPYIIWLVEQTKAANGNWENILTNEFWGDQLIELKFLTMSIKQMMNKFKINKSGNFWIDNGIVGLYKVIVVLGQNDCCELTQNGLEFSFEDKEVCVNVLNKARLVVVAHYLKNTGNFGWIYKDAAFEIYKRKDFKMHLKPFFTGKTPKTEGALFVPDTKDNELGGKGRRMTHIEYEAFQKFKDDNADRIENNKKLKIENKGYVNSPPAYEIGGDFNLTFLEEGKKICSFSGKKI